MLEAAGIVLTVLLSIPSLAAVREDQATLAELLRTGDLICRLYRSGSHAPRPRFADMLLIFDQVGARAGTARVFSSNSIGSHKVRLDADKTGVHLVEDLSGSVFVTTLLSCEARSGSGRCVRFSAVNSWHFVRGAQDDPDRALRRKPRASYAGSCEAWQLEDPPQSAK